MFALPGRKGETTDKFYNFCLVPRVLFHPHILRNVEQVFYWELGMSSFFKNFLQHFSFKKIVGGSFFFGWSSWNISYFNYLLIWSLNQCWVVLAFYEEPPILVFFFFFFFLLKFSNWIGFQFHKKKLEQKFSSGLVLEKKTKTQVLVMKIRPSFKD